MADACAVKERIATEIAKTQLQHAHVTTVTSLPRKPDCRSFIDEQVESMVDWDSLNANLQVRGRLGVRHVCAEFKHAGIILSLAATDSIGPLPSTRVSFGTTPQTTVATPLLHTHTLCPCVTGPPPGLVRGATARGHLPDYRRVPSPGPPQHGTSPPSCVCPLSLLRIAFPSGPSCYCASRFDTHTRLLCCLHTIAFVNT